MTYRASLLPFALTLIVIGRPQLPQEPDFSGEWVLVNASDARSEQPPALTVHQTITRTNVRGEPIKPFYSSITVERHFDKAAASDSHTFYIGTIGGTVPGLPVEGSLPQREWTTESVKWECDQLVIRTTRSSQPRHQPGPRSEHDEVWSLDEDGRLLIAISDRSPGSAPRTLNLVYERRPLVLASSVSVSASVRRW